jgi:phosphomannomutase
MENYVSVKFGTSGLRGLSVDLIGSTTRTYVSAFADYLLSSAKAKPGSHVFVGFDFRDSSESIANTALQALHDAGLVPVNCGTVPTPALAYHAIKNSSASMMITGSHIPADRNGIKFYRPDGEIDKTDEANIMARAQKTLNDPAPHRTLAPFKQNQSEVEAQFIWRNQIVLNPNALAGLHVGVYQHSTVARDILVRVLEYYGARVTALGRSETFIPVDTEAVSPQTLNLLKSWANTKNCDVFVSADGDGDRPLVADEAGKPIRGDIIGLLTAEFLKARSVVTPITSNSSIEKEVEAKVVRTRVGSPFVIEGMNAQVLENPYGVMGFEANGGVLTASDFHMANGILSALPTRDCFLPILAVLNFCKSANQPLSLSIALRQFSSADSDRLENFPQKKSIALFDHLTRVPQNLLDFLKDIGEVVSVDHLDGLRATLKDGSIIHYRPSGNAPELRCYTEASSAAAARDLLKRGLAAAAAFQES